MSDSFHQRLREIRGYFEHGDHHLGYRRLLDAAIETDNFEVYGETLRFADWYDTRREEEGVNERVAVLLTHIGNGYRQPQLPEPAVKLLANQVAKTYARGNFSLSPMNVDLHPSEIIGLVGENGNGKTTLLRLLYGELKPDRGTISYRFAEKEKPKDFYAIKSRLAFIPQRPAAWYGSLMDNLQYATTYTGLKGRENYLWTEMIIARMGLRPYRSYTWGRISSGYKMRFELARTLLRKPEVLLLDEPLANLDVLAQQIILEDLKFLAQSPTRPLSILLSSQQLYEVEKVSDRVIFLQKGVARYQLTSVEDSEAPQPLILELETSASREVLQQVLEGAGLQKLSFNGGVYIVYFRAGTGMGTVLAALAQASLPLKYLRDISVSSRRFFDA